MLFSDNVPLEQEIDLKRMAKERGLLMMGPDAGTAIINGKPLCFANVVRQGDIGLVGASGTGLQEVSVAIHKEGAGVSQAIGTGGRDLKNDEVGGTMMLMGIEALKNDDATSVITVISKPPSNSVAEKVISALKETGKPCVVHFIGLAARESEGNVHFAGNLEETAGMSVALSRGEKYTPRTFTISDSEVERIVEAESRGMAGEQQFLRGLFTGGTLADEALILLHGTIGDVFSNNQEEKYQLPDPHTSQGHTIVDLGEDQFTVGRPHPMIDPSTRTDRIEREMEDPEMAVLLLDVVIGYGSGDDPAGAMTEHIRRAKEAAASRGGYLSVIASVTGTEQDPQRLDAQRRTLEDAGCVVMPSNYQAAMLAKRILEKAGTQ
jgi:succinyl-CoA synthetase alpha subunit